MINTFPAFAPSLVPVYPSIAGLQLYIGPGTVDINGTTIFFQGLSIPISPLAITYVYLNMATGAINSNTTGFSGNVWPIAIATTSSTEIITLLDVRPDVSGVGGGSGGGGITRYNFLTSPDGVTTTFSTTTVITANTLVILNGLILSAGIDYSYIGTTVTFFTAPGSTDEIFLYQNGGSGGGGGGGIASAADTVLSLAGPGTAPVSQGTNYLFYCADGTVRALPPPTGLVGQWATFIKRGNGAAVTISGGISGTKYLTNQNQYIRFQTDGLAWDVVGGN